MTRKNGAVLLTLGLALAACGGPQAEPTAPSAGNGTSPDEAGGGRIAEGEATLKQKDFEKARAIFAAIVKENPDHPKANHYLGVALENLDRKEEAEKHYRAALAAAPGFAESVLNLSAMLIETERFDEAARTIEAGLEKHPKDPFLHTNLGYALAGKNDAKGAVASFGKALALADNAETRVARAALLLDEKKVDEAVADLKKAASKASDDVGLLATIGDLFARAGAYADCVSVFDTAIKVKPAAELLVGRGLCRRGLKDHVGAKKDYEKAIELDANFGPAYFFLGQHLLLIDKKKAEAIKAFESCARVAPQSKCKEAAAKAKKRK